MSEDKKDNKDNKTTDFNFAAANTKTVKKEKGRRSIGSMFFVSFFTTIIVLAIIVLVFFFGFTKTTVFDDVKSNFATFIKDNLNIKDNCDNNNCDLSTADIKGIKDLNDITITVAKKTIPSVVAIEIEYNVSSFFSSGKTAAKGSGVIISEDGYILTNNHVVNPQKTSSFYEVSEANKVTVTFSDGEKADAKIIGKDAQTDLAIIKVEKQNLPAAKFGDSDKLQIGEFVMAIGSPLGFDGSVSIGIVSGLNRKIEASRFCI